MKPLIVYASKYGNTKQYAQWLSQETGGLLREIDALKADDFTGCGACVFGGGVYASNIRGLAKFKKQAQRFQQLPTAIFAVGLTVPSTALETELKTANLSGTLQGLPLFCLRGGLDRARLRPVDRTLVRMLDAMLKKKGLPLEDGDWKEKETLAPIRNWLSTLE